MKSDWGPTGEKALDLARTGPTNWLTERRSADEREQEGKIDFENAV